MSFRKSIAVSAVATPAGWTTLPTGAAPARVGIGRSVGSAHPALAATGAIHPGSARAGVTPRATVAAHDALAYVNPTPLAERASAPGYAWGALATRTSVTNQPKTSHEIVRGEAYNATVSIPQQTAVPVAAKADGSGVAHNAAITGASLSSTPFTATGTGEANDAVVTGGSTALPVLLSDGNNASHITASPTLTTARNQAASIVFAALGIPAGGVIEWIAPVVTEAHYPDSGYFTVAELHASNGVGQHKTPWSLTQTGATPADGEFRTSIGTVHPSASDGVTWSECDDDTFTALVAWGPVWYDVTSTVTAPPRLAELALLVSYRNAPTVTITSPAGTQTNPRVPIVWSVLEGGVLAEASPALDTRQESYRAIVVLDGELDGAAVAAGDPGFDPTTATAAFDTGRVYSATTAVTVTSHLSPADYWFYVMAWQPPVGATEMASDWAEVGPITVDVSSVLPGGAAAVAAPTVTVVEDNATYAMDITVTRVAPGIGEVAPTYFVVQRLDGGVWTDLQGATNLTGAGPWTVSDSSPPAGQTAQYRARGVYVV